MSEESPQTTNEAAPLDPDRLARLVASLLSERKGEDIAILEMTEVLPITDYFVIATGQNDRHVAALREGVEKRLKELKVAWINRSNRDSKSWVLLDYGPVVVHIFRPEAREYYDLENLWADAGRVEFEPDPPRDE